MINYRMRLNQILGSPSLVTRCTELTSFMEMCSVEELKTYYQVIVENIFGFPSFAGWGIRRLTRNFQPKETEAVLRFLAPEGPLFKAIYRLMTDRNFRLEYPLTSLPPVLEERISRLDIPEFFVKKVHITYDSYGQATILRNVFVNPFEYYFFVFTYVNLSVGSNQNYLMGWGTLNDNLYTNLLDEYNNYFFPCDGRGVPPMSTHQGRLQPESTFNPDPVIQSDRNGIAPTTAAASPSSRSLPVERPTLFRASLFQESMTVSATRDTSFTSSSTYSYLDVWRSETLLNVFMEMWMSVECNDTVSSYFRSSLPSVELVKSVRMIVRHQHYFANCINQQALHPMESLKRTVLPAYQKKLYLFLRHLFNRWPLDNTFRIVYETWLSYIQPWRYAKMDRFRQFRDKEEPQIDSFWFGFLVDNILFYTVLFQQMLPRFLRADLTSPKNAQMLFRVSKVFATQENLKPLLQEIESVLIKFILNQDYHPGGTGASHGFYLGGGGSHSITSESGVGVSSLAEHCPPSRLANVKQLMVELDGNAPYKPLFSDETKHLIKNLVNIINQAIEVVGKTTDVTIPAKQKASSFLKFWEHGDNSWSASKLDQASVVDKSRVPQLLSIAKEQLVHFFELNKQEIQSLDGNFDDDNELIEGMHLTPGDFSSSIYASLTPKGTFPDDMVTPRGNPDLVPMRSYEIPFLVRFLYSISNRLNQKFGQEITNIYYSRDKWGKFARASLARPVLYRVIEKVTPGRQLKTTKYLPPRVNLRPLASYQVVLTISLVILLGSICSYSPLFIIFLFCVAYVSYVVVKGMLEQSQYLDDLLRDFQPYIDRSLDDSDDYYDR